jgi:lysophospholipase L1-like esterase
MIVNRLFSFVLTLIISSPLTPTLLADPGDSLLASEIRIIGDSIFTTGGNMIRGHLESISGLTIDTHANGGAVMSQVREQYLNIKDQNIRTIIMDGGGNDILGDSGNCRNQNNDSCKAHIEQVVETARTLFEEMAENGVENIVFMTCHYPMGWNSGYVDAINYGTSLITEVCAEARSRCIIVDPRESFQGKSHYLEWDGVHPNRTGAQVMADLIWQAMVENWASPRNPDNKLR